MTDTRWLHLLRNQTFVLSEQEERRAFGEGRWSNHALEVARNRLVKLITEVCTLLYMLQIILWAGDIKNEALKLSEECKLMAKEDKKFSNRCETAEDMQTPGLKARLDLLDLLLPLTYKDSPKINVSSLLFYIKLMWI